MTIATKLDSLTFNGNTWPDVLVSKGAYPDGGLALILDSEGEPLTTASINLAPSYGLIPKEGAIFIKNYSENEGLAEALVAAGVVRLTGRREFFGPFGAPAVEAEVLI